MKEKINSIICELEIINDEIGTQERSIDNQLSDIEYINDNLNNVSSELYDLRTRVNNLQDDLHELSKELESETNTIGYTKEEVELMIANCIEAYKTQLKEKLDDINISYIIGTEISLRENFRNSQSNERDEL